MLPSVVVDGQTDVIERSRVRRRWWLVPYNNKAPYAYLDPQNSHTPIPSPLSSLPSSTLPHPSYLQVTHPSSAKQHPRLHTMSNFQLPAGFKPSAPPAASGSGGNGQSSEEQQAALERAVAQEEMKRGMISAMLEPAARERCELDQSF